MEVILVIGVIIYGCIFLYMIYYNLDMKGNHNNLDNKRNYNSIVNFEYGDTIFFIAKNYGYYVNEGNFNGITSDKIKINHTWYILSDFHEFLNFDLILRKSNLIKNKQIDISDTNYDILNKIKQYHNYYHLLGGHSDIQITLKNQKRMKLNGGLKSFDGNIINIELTSIEYNEYGNPSISIHEDKCNIFIDLNDIKDINFPYIERKIKEYNDEKNSIDYFNYLKNK